MKRSMPYLLTLAVMLIAMGEDDHVANFKLKNLNDEKVELKTLLMQGPVVLDFWATWCKPCEKAFPELNALYKKYKDQGLTVVGINEDGSRSHAKVKPFVNRLKIEFPILMDENNNVMRKLEAYSLPTTVLLSSDGRVIFRHAGFNQKAIEELEQHIVSLLKQSKGS